MGLVLRLVRSVGWRLRSWIFDNMFLGVCGLKRG